MLLLLIVIVIDIILIILNIIVIIVIFILILLFLFSMINVMLIAQMFHEYKITMSAAIMSAIITILEIKQR